MINAWALKVAQERVWVLWTLTPADPVGRNVHAMSDDRVSVFGRLFTAHGSFPRGRIPKQSKDCWLPVSIRRAAREPYPDPLNPLSCFGLFLLFLLFLLPKDQWEFQSAQSTWKCKITRLLDYLLRASGEPVSHLITFWYQRALGRLEGPFLKPANLVAVPVLP